MKNKKKILSGFIFSLLILGIISPLLSQSTLDTVDDPFKLNIDDAYIEVYAYDELTLDPIQGADVELYDEFYITIDSGITDIDGFINFTSLSLGFYEIEIRATDYENNGSYVTIESEDEEKIVEFYLAKIFVPGDGFIDVYVKDFETTDPIAGASVQLNNEYGSYLTDGLTDGAGFYNFTGLGAATYTIESSAYGYHYQSDSVTIDYDGEGEEMEINLKPEYVSGVGFIDVFVNDNVTHTPIVGAEVWLYDEYYYYIDNGITDGTGFYNFTNLGVGDYIVEANADGYVLNSSSVYIDFDGEEEYLMLYLSLFVRTFDILSPSDSQTVEGGSVLVEFDASEPFDLQTIEVSVNAVHITTISYGGSSTECIVPVFENGTNTILLEGTWNDASMASDTVNIDSNNVIPTVNIKEGDILNYRQLDLVGGLTGDFNFTFTTWVSTFEMLTHFTVHQYDAGGTIMYGEYFLTVNVLNGYVAMDSSNMFFEYRHFFPFSSLLPSPVVGDKMAYVPWTDILTVNGSMLWEYTDVWTLEHWSGNIVFYFEKSSNILQYFLYPGLMEAFILETTIDFLNPYVSDVADFGYVEGDTGNVISWDATDMNPWNYSIYKDDVLQQSLNWTAGTPIVINVDGLTTGGVTSGVFVYRIVVMDLAGNIAEDTVTITVTHVVPELGLISNLVLISTIVFVAYVIMRKREK